MPATTQKLHKVEDKTDQKQPDLASVIGVSLLKRLGKPNNLHMMKVIHLWNNHYRVNVWVSILGNNSLHDQRRIEHSYFVSVDEHGEILDSKPEIKRIYTETGEDTRPKVSKRPILI
jgi:hypothetical protein